MKLKNLTNIVASAVLAMSISCASTVNLYSRETDANTRYSDVHKYPLSHKYFSECEKYNKDIENNKDNLWEWIVCNYSKLDEIAKICVREGYKKSLLLNTKDGCFEVLVKNHTSDDPNFFTNISPELLDTIGEYCESE